ncbi:hypothetical protein NDU88_005387 [Pleurodeles waltl]|uniref:Uncharacterized protein n=1 Tax=Pleurodeles waltl TaxID=8319 RepID=A0AAV7LLB8_PLEWA|nr:hypothetical protein NDU88_005387 [Pleurodeles waltl]
MRWTPCTGDYHARKNHWCQESWEKKKRRKKTPKCGVKTGRHHQPLSASPSQLRRVVATRVGDSSGLTSGDSIEQQHERRERCRHPHHPAPTAAIELKALQPFRSAEKQAGLGDLGG